MMWEIWQDLIVMLACAISNATDKAENHYQQREDMYMERILKYNEEERMIFPKLYGELVMALEKKPEQDFLGEVFMQLGLGSEWHGQFFTPYHVCEAMAKTITTNALESIDEKGYITVLDPTCGAGATLIAFANSLQEKYHENKRQDNWQHKVLFIGQDIDFTVGLMCYIQMSLRGCAGFVKIGDTLANPVKAGEDDKSYWYTTMYNHEIWHLRRKFHFMDAMLKRVKPQETELSPKQPKQAPEPPVITKETPQLYQVKENGQLSLF